MPRYQTSTGRAVRADIEAKFKGDFADGAEVTLGYRDVGFPVVYRAAA